MKKLLLAAILLVSIQAQAYYPITPLPLRKLIIESQVIIHGKVIRLGNEKSANKNDHWDNGIAIIQVMEVLQGETKADTIKVYYTPGLICPAPPTYILDEEEIIFLDKAAKNKDAFITHALSYGVKNGLGPEGIAVYKQRIKEMQEILKLPSSTRKDEATMDWLVSCAVNKHTRWEGVYELSPQSDFMSAYDEDPDPLRKEAFLTTAQRKRLFDALFESDSLDYSDLGMIDIVLGVDDAKLLKYLKSGLARLDKNEIWIAAMFTDRIVYLTGDEELKKLSKEFEETWMNDKQAQKQNEIFRKILARTQNLELKKPIYASNDSN